MKKIKNYFTKAKTLWIAPVYALIIVLATPPGLAWPYKLIFLLYSLAIFVIIFYKTRKTKNENTEIIYQGARKLDNFFIGLLIFSVLLLILTRLLPFIRFGEAPLGYDTGYYLNSLRSFYGGSAQYEAFYFNLLPFIFSGVSPLVALNFVYIASQFLIAGGIYFLCRSFKSKNSLALAAIAVFLFAASVTQFQAYWWMLGQQLLAVAFLLFTMGLILRNSYFAIFTGGIGLAIHLPTFIILFFAFVVLFFVRFMQILFRKRKIDKNFIYICSTGIGIALIILFIKRASSYTFTFYIIEHGGMATSFLYYEVPKMLGSFINAAKYHLNSYLIVPFSVIGLLLIKKWKSLLAGNQEFLAILYSSLGGLLVLTSFPFIYQQRFLIILDFVLVIFAVPAFLIFISRFISDKMGKIIIVLFLAVFSLRIGFVVYHQTPQLFAEELNEMKSMSINLERDSIILSANSLYDPWLRGFTPFMIVSPGMQNDRWNIEKWKTYWGGDSNETRYELLNEILLDKRYPSMPLYIFIGNRENANLPYQNFIRNNPHFKNISPHFWKYLPEI